MHRQGPYPTVSRRRMGEESESPSGSEDHDAEGEHDDSRFGGPVGGGGGGGGMGGGHSHGDTGGAPATVFGPNGEVKFKRKIACMACRTIKLRCLLATPQSANDDPCHRCTRMAIPCVYKKKRRPVRPGQERPEGGELAYANSSEDRAAGKEKVSGKVYGMTMKPAREERAGMVYGHSAGESRVPGSSARDHNTFMSPPEHYPRDTPRNYLPPIEHSSTGRSDFGGTLGDDISSGGAGVGTGSSRQPYHAAMSSSRADDVFPRPPLMTGGSSEMSNGGMWMDTSNERGAPASAQVDDYGFMQSQMRHAPESERNVQSMYRNAAYFPPPEEDPLYRTTTSDERSSNYARFAVGEIEGERPAYNMASVSPNSRPSNATTTPGTTSGLGVLAAASSSHARPRTLMRMSTEGELKQMDMAIPEDEEQTLQDKVRERELQSRARPSRQSMTLSSVLDHLRRDLSPYAESERTTAERRRRSRSRSEDAGKDKAAQGNKRMRWEESNRSGALTPGLSWERSRPHGDGPAQPSVRDRVPEIDPSLEMADADTFDQADWNPVKLGILQTADVQYLFDCYFGKLNYYIALLDPVLHTIPYTKRTCPELFVAILTVAARSFLPDQYPALRKLANKLVGEAFGQGRAEVGLIQTLSLLSVWKDGSDKSHWLKISCATSIAFILQLDAKPVRPLPQDEMQAREILNRERTWIQIFSTDRTLHMVFGRPRMCNPETQWSIARWVTDHPQFPCYSDAMLAASQGSGGLINGMRQHKAFEPDGIRFKMTVHQFKADFAKWDATWFGAETPAPVHPTSMIMLRYYALMCDFEFSEFQRLSMPGLSTNEAITESVVRAVDLLKYVVEHLAPADIMVYAPDIITIGTAKAGIFLVRYAAQIEPTVNAEISQLFRQLVQICRTASHGMDTAFYQAKFFSSLKRVGSVAPTRVGSKFGSPRQTGKALAAAAAFAEAEREGGGAEEGALSGDALTARLKEIANEHGQGAVDAAMALGQANAAGAGANGLGTEPFTLEDLLMESADWFSLDVMNQLNDTAWGGTVPHDHANMHGQGVAGVGPPGGQMSAAAQAAAAAAANWPQNDFF